jgi:uncharacterized protein YhbP (UPF0306 family)
MKEIIKDFIQHQTCATFSCVDNTGSPYCFSCFYAFNDEENLLYFKSSVDSHHVALMKENPLIAGTILPDKLNTFLIKGIQFEGMVSDAKGEAAKQASRLYYKKHPMAHAMPGEVWIIRIDHIKMTYSTTGFINKTSWSRESEVLN